MTVRRENKMWQSHFFKKDVSSIQEQNQAGSTAIWFQVRLNVNCKCNTYQMNNQEGNNFELIPSRSREIIRKASHEKLKINFFQDPDFVSFHYLFPSWRNNNLLIFSIKNKPKSRAQIKNHQTLLLHIYFNRVITRILNDYQRLHGKMTEKIEREVCYWRGQSQSTVKTTRRGGHRTRQKVRQPKLILRTNNAHVAVFLMPTGRIKASDESWQWIIVTKMPEKL